MKALIFALLLSLGVSASASTYAKGSPAHAHHEKAPANDHDADD